MEESLTSSPWRGISELFMNGEIVVQEWSWGLWSMHIIGDSGVPIELAAVEPARTDLKHSSPYLYKPPGFGQGAMSRICTAYRAFGCLEPEAESEMFPRWRRPMFRIANIPLRGDYGGGYAMDNESYGTLILQHFQEFRAAVDELVREPDIISLMLVLQEAKTALRWVYHHYFQRRVNHRFFPSPGFYLHFQCARDLSHPTSGVKIMEQVDDFSPYIGLRRFCLRPMNYGGKIGFLEQEAVTEMFQRTQARSQPFRGINSDEATDPVGGNYGSYWMDKDYYARLIIQRSLQEIRIIVDKLIREPGSKSLQLAMEDARARLRYLYRLYSQLVKKFPSLPSLSLSVLRTNPWHQYLDGPVEYEVNKCLDNYIDGRTMKQFSVAHPFIRNLYENSFGRPKSMATKLLGMVQTAPGSTSLWTPKVVNGPEHRSVPDKGDGFRNAATWLVATAAPHHATGNRELLTGFTPEEEDLFLQAGDGAPMEVRGRGAVVTDAVVLPDVWFVPGLAANLVSAGQLAELDYSIGFARGACRIVDVGGALAGEARIREDGLFELQFLKLPLAM